MSEQTYAAMREYIKLAVELEGRKIREELRSAPPTEIRSVEGPPGKDGPPGRDGKDGRDGIDGKPGERGADGIATREELESIVEARFADIQVRNFADMYQGVFQPERDYTRGQLATWGGSLFLALQNTRAKPETSPDWRLIVKRGADGKR